VKRKISSYRGTNALANGTVIYIYIYILFFLSHDAKQTSEQKLLCVQSSRCLMFDLILGLITEGPKSK
jgi:hypothetical protein